MRDTLAHVRRYRAPDDARAWRDLLGTLAAWVLCVGALPRLPWLAAPLLPLLIMRLFAVFHAAGHHGFFSSRRLDTVVGHVLSVIVITPLRQWQETHERHHRVFGDLDADDPGDPILFTWQDYSSWSARKRLSWRVLREPWFFFLVVPAFRWSVEYLWASRSPLVALGLAMLAAHAVWVSPWILLSYYLASVLAFAFFHVHHAVDRGYRDRHDRHDRWQASVEGSTYLRLPAALAWFSYGLEYHHIHHICSSVPPYRMAACHHDAPPGTWRDVTVVTLSGAFAALRNTMWDEEGRRFARFGDERP